MLLDVANSCERRPRIAGLATPRAGRTLYVAAGLRSRGGDNDSAGTHGVLVHHSSPPAVSAPPPSTPLCEKDTASGRMLLGATVEPAHGTGGGLHCLARYPPDRRADDAGT